ncbi:MAG: hypothetical protein ACLSHC_04985 [Bilophila wadsworthia]
MLFSAIFVVSLIGTLFTTYLFMKSTAVESTRFLADDLTSQLNTVYSLLEGMSEQPLIKDTSISVQERAASMKTYADAFGFWMIGVVDPDGTISSTLRPKTGKVQRGYIPRIMASGKREISDPFPAGATGDMTYSQFMPIKKDGKVVSICFVTTPLSLLSERVTRRDHTGNGYYLMLSSTGSLIAHPNPAMSLTHIRDHVAGERFLYGSNRKPSSRHRAIAGTFISILGIRSTAFMNIPEVGWTLIHRVKILPTVKACCWPFSRRCVHPAVRGALSLRAYRHFAGTQAGGQHPAASRRAEQKRQCRRQHHGRGCVQHHQHQPQRVVRRPYRAAYAQPLPPAGQRHHRKDAGQAIRGLHPRHGQP